MKNRLISFFSILIAFQASAIHAQASKPNVILIITDDQGYGDIAAHGHPFVKTPNLDQLHKSSVRLTNFHVMPLCAPTRAMLMTGKNPLESGVWATVLGRSILPPEGLTMPRLFLQNGYSTGMFGKWHLGDNAPARPHDKGFQTAIYLGGGGIGQTPDYWGNDYIDDTYYKNGKPVQASGYCTDFFFREAMNFIRENREKPFFAYIATNAPHSPYIPPPDLAQAYRAIPGIDNPTAAFYAMIENIDTNIGRLNSFLTENRLNENTILIFMTDNGTAQGLKAPGAFNAGMRAAKGALYEGGHRVPCFIRWPGGQLPQNGGMDIADLTSGIDILPTLAGLCGLDLKSEAKNQVQGVDLSPRLRGNEMKSLTERFHFVQFSQEDLPPEKNRAAVMQGPWRLINHKELYNIEDDPGQKQNIIDKNPEKAAELANVHNTWYEKVSPDPKKMNPIWVGSPLENPVHLNAMDWHTGSNPGNLAWNQPAIRRGMKSTGFWAIDVRQAGDYQIRLRRWPVESKLKIDEKPMNPNQPAIAQARLAIGSQQATKPVNASEELIEFQMKLNSGQIELKADFLDASGNILFGAYYVEMTLIKTR